MSRAVLVVLMGALSSLSCRSDPAPVPALPQERVAWTTSRVVGSPEPPPPYRARRAFPKLSFNRPLYMACEPGTDRAVVVEQGGRILAFRNHPDSDRTDVFLELPETWFYSLMFHPRYAENRQVYVFSNGPPSSRTGKKNRILRYVVRDGKCDRSTEHLVIEWVSNGHDGGEMAFGPDGMLYISAGDGTSDSDGNVTGQDLSDLNSGMIRIDVERPEPGRGYSVPKDNPFLSIPGARPELWAYGFRNPWRMTFDPATGDLWVGDIGQDLWEMVQVVRKGDNYGWSVVEGGHPFHSKRALGPTPVTRPLIVHPHSEARSVTGGIVYTGDRFADLKGAYIYGDYATGRIWAVRYVGGKITWHREIADTASAMLGFAQDAAGEIYFVDYGGQIHQLEPSPPQWDPALFPRTLSASGVFDSVPGYRIHPGLVAYSVNSPLWSDGAFKERHAGIPGDGKIDFHEDAPWGFPDGTVLVKTFSLEMEQGNPASRKRIETRFLMKQQNEWAGYSYLWNDAQTEGTLVGSAGLQREISIADASAPGGRRKQTWYYPSRADCMVCHSRAGSYVLGLNTPQMNRDDEGGGNQIARLERLGFFKLDVLEHLRARTDRWRKAAAPPFRAVFARRWDQIRNSLSRRWKMEERITGVLPRRPDSYRRLADPYDPEAPLADRARSYLHSNCAQCHVEAGGGNSAFDVHANTRPARMNLIDARPLHDPFGIADARIVAPGSPDRSVLAHRISRRGPGQMPPLASSLVDEPAVRLINDWIRSLKSP